MAAAGGEAKGEEPASPASPAVKDKEESKRPENSNFKQQRLPAWQPIMSPKPVIGCFLITGLLFLGIGIAIVAASDSVVEIDVRYDHKKACPREEILENVDGNGTRWACPLLHVEFTIPKEMPSPVFLYYKLENFYQNHRLYAKSVSDQQLSGGTPSSIPSDCRPMAEIGKMHSLTQNGWNGSVWYDANTQVNLANVLYNPCGLVAWSMFNDTLSLYEKQTSATAASATATPICEGGAFDEVGNVLTGFGPQKCEKKGIAWPSDPGVRFTKPAHQRMETLTFRGFPDMPDQYRVKPPANEAPWSYHAYNGWYIGEEGHSIPNPADEDFMVWMRLASLSSFRKLYRRITVDLAPGLYEMRIAQRYDVRSFGGKKSFVLSTSSWIGGKNYFLAGMYIAVGAVCLILGAAFLAKYRNTPRAGRVI